MFESNHSGCCTDNQPWQVAGWGGEKKGRPFKRLLQQSRWERPTSPFTELLLGASILYMWSDLILTTTLWGGVLSILLYKKRNWGSKSSSPWPKMSLYMVKLGSKPDYSTDLELLVHSSRCTSAQGPSKSSWEPVCFPGCWSPSWTFWWHLFTLHWSPFP